MKYARREVRLFAALFLLLVAGILASMGRPELLDNLLGRATSTPGIGTTSPSTVSTSTLYTVLRAVDGDTIKLDTGEDVRYIGINTPETVHPTKGAECFGKEASNKNKELVTGKKVRLEKDVSDKDRYGRLLRYVYLEDGTFVNELLVKEGFAFVATFPPDVKYSKHFVELEREAREAKRGLWSACPNK